MLANTSISYSQVTLIKSISWPPKRGRVHYTTCSTHTHTFPLCGIKVLLNHPSWKLKCTLTAWMRKMDACVQLTFLCKICGKDFEPFIRLDGRRSMEDTTNMAVVYMSINNNIEIYLNKYVAVPLSFHWRSESSTRTSVYENLIYHPLNKIQ